MRHFTFHDLIITPLVQSQCRKIKLLLAVTRICNKQAVQITREKWKCK